MTRRKEHVTCQMHPHTHQNSRGEPSLQINPTCSRPWDLNWRGRLWQTRVRKTPRQRCKKLASFYPLKLLRKLNEWNSFSCRAADQPSSFHTFDIWSKLCKSARNGAQRQALEVSKATYVFIWLVCKDRQNILRMCDRARPLFSVGGSSGRV